jgi:D-lactate dehydrogenase (cytochrome)
MRENVLALTVVLPNGKVIRTSRRARKSAAGYDLTRLFIGSEGTLGIITEITLRLYGIPEAISAAVVGFPNIEAAVNTAILTIQSGIPVARIELLDEVQMDAVNKYSKLHYEAQPTLFLEFHGSEETVEAEAREVGEIARENGSGTLLWATEPGERQRLWQARHDAYYAALALRPGCMALTTDVCVPISYLSECIHETKKDLEGSFLKAPLVGHVGDGNFHLIFLMDPASLEDLDEAERINERLVHRALAMDGTCTGEHGVGLGKRWFLEEEHGEALSAMRAIKKALDPQGIMNPGKILPPVLPPVRSGT